VIIVEEKLKKFVLPSRNNLIIHTNVLEVFSFYRQRSLTDSESGVFLLGYQNLTTNSIIIDDLSIPQKKDLKKPIRFIIRDSGHKKNPTGSKGRIFFSRNLAYSSSRFCFSFIH